MKGFILKEPPSLRFSLCLLFITAVGLILIVSLGIAGHLMEQHLLRQTQEGLKKEIFLSYALLESRNPGPWHLQGDALYKGEVKIDQHYPVLGEIAAITGEMITLFCRDTRVATTIRDEKGQPIVGTKAPPEVGAKVLGQGECYFGHTFIAGKPYITAYLPLKNPEGETVGMYFLGQSIEHIQEAKLASLTRQLSVTGLSLFLGTLLLLLFFTKSITEPFSQVTGACREIARGNWGMRLMPQRFKELDIIAEALNTMAVRLESLFNQIRCLAREYEAIFQASGDAMRIIDTSFRIKAQNRKMGLLSRVPEEKALGKKCYHIFRHPFCGGDTCILKRILAGERLVELETEMMRKDGSSVWVELVATPLENEKGELGGIIESFRDITSRKEAEKKLLYLSLHDPLTGLYNRAYFEEEMARLNPQRQGPISILVMDLDGLKIVNDTLGHQAGDELLRTAARLIRRCLRKEDCLARIGGDEFAAILVKTGTSAAQEICQRIRQAVEDYNQKEKPLIPLSLSIGMATTEGSLSLNEVFKQADNNMYREKLLARKQHPQRHRPSPHGRPRGPGFRHQGTHRPPRRIGNPYGPKTGIRREPYGQPQAPGPIPRHRGSGYTRSHSF